MSRKADEPGQLDELQQLMDELKERERKDAKVDDAPPDQGDDDDDDGDNGDDKPSQSQKPIPSMRLKRPAIGFAIGTLLGGIVGIVAGYRCGHQNEREDLTCDDWIKHRVNSTVLPHDSADGCEEFGLDVCKPPGGCKNTQVLQRNVHGTLVTEGVHVECHPDGGFKTYKNYYDGQLVREQTFDRYGRPLTFIEYNDHNGPGGSRLFSYKMDMTYTSTGGWTKIEEFPTDVHYPKIGKTICALESGHSVGAVTRSRKWSRDDAAWEPSPRSMLAAVGSKCDKNGVIEE